MEGEKLRWGSDGAQMVQKESHVQDKAERKGR